MKFFDYCDDNKILLATYPPHSTHSLQPLDVGIFSPLSHAYSSELEAYLHISMGLSHITKQDFFRLFFPAWVKALSSKNIISSWRTVGIHPFNPEIVLARFSREPQSRPSTKNILLKLQCKGLQIALQNKKKKRQRGKPLQFQLKASDNGGAVFYSPQKIQQAQDLQLGKERAAEQLKASKEEQKVRRQQEKEAKQRLIEDHRKIQASQQEIHCLEAEQKRQEKEDARISKEAAKQLQIDFQQAKKTPRKSSKASNHTDTQDTGPPSHVVVEEVPPTVNRRGREIRLPQRFRTN
ncbi:hypothetical protein AN8487.2 [Aspergillus nidulans FGSC A4]|uniref:DDE-1 domain-containing protein n=1 Tax=Emericella nidulans (strain FGSC A4 / ATCC 38163 / CBS 112.46 / NRRL 194 / M139) TaxID=227321 RepID=Q5AT93_EMENI|nr:hypothetical protein [Aspergillus nidulans FGSC A4]EAA67109.1 hypothetical protein AN8487.2 [Aspergillus nidulans FGSC A4]CBF80652.1 TPA: conserved hypothetical protein [Aspergillus nidulans FGSC A4]|eukprot:XP_681756.1 hypothetical protein AN8487.2 [Aspergillus nidulans FGSC A4]